jgi:hypothetical protein
MTRSRRLFVAAIFALIGIALSAYFVEYRVVPAHLCPGSRDVGCSPANEILFLGLTSVAPPPGSEVAKFHGRMGAERGLFARNGYKPVAAGIGGILLPILFGMTALFFVVSRSSTSNQLARS